LQNVDESDGGLQFKMRISLRSFHALAIANAFIVREVTKFRTSVQNQSPRRTSKIRVKDPIRSQGWDVGFFNK